MGNQYFLSHWNLEKPPTFWDKPRHQPIWVLHSPPVTTSHHQLPICPLSSSTGHPHKATNTGPSECPGSTVHGLIKPITNKNLDWWPTKKKRGPWFVVPFWEVEIDCLWSMESMDFVYSHRQEWALHGLVQKKKCSCTVVCKRGKRFWGPMCCESKLQPHVKDGSIRKPKRTKQSIYARCYLNMHAVDFIFLYFFGGGCLICAAGIHPQTPKVLIQSIF